MLRIQLNVLKFGLIRLPQVLPIILAYESNMMIIKAFIRMGVAGLGTETQQAFIHFIDAIHQQLNEAILDLFAYFRAHAQ